MSNKGLIVITGASSGIGEATARKFSEQGYALLLLARRLERLQALDLPNCLCEAVDVTDAAVMRDAVAKAQQQFGPVQGLVNNAGVMLLETVADQDPAEWESMMAVNVHGVLNGVKAVIASMLEQSHGTIINISSIAGFKSFPKHAAYCATKYAVRGFSETLRQEVAAENIRVIIISPGVVETELLGHTTSDQVIADYQDWKKDIGGAINPEDIANAIDYAYNQPQNVCVRELVIAPTKQVD